MTGTPVPLGAQTHYFRAFNRMNKPMDLLDEWATKRARIPHPWVHEKSFVICSFIKPKGTLVK